MRDVKTDPRPGDELRGPRYDGPVTLQILRRKPRLLISDGQFSFNMSLATFRKWAATAEVVRRADECTCKIEPHYSEDGSPGWEYEMEKCPLCRLAPRMAAALRAVEDHMLCTHRDDVDCPTCFELHAIVRELEAGK